MMGPGNALDNPAGWADAFAELGDSFSSSARKSAGGPPAATPSTAAKEEFGRFNRLDLSGMGD